MTKRWFWISGGAFLIVIFLITGCFVIDNPFTGIPPGPWRAVLKLDPSTITPNPKGEPLPEKVGLKFEEVTQGELPFNFEVIYENDSVFYIDIINGKERIKVDDIIIGRDRRTAKDTLIINLPVFDSYIKGIFEERVIEGEWVVPSRGNYTIPFVAKHGKDHRFTQLSKPPAMDVSGKWEVTFEIETDHPYKAIGEFEQQGNKLLGTFMTETGDYRFLEGTIQADKLYLSCFDGAHSFLFEAKIREDQTLIGSFRNGKHYQTIWEAKRNPDFQLTSANELTYIKKGYESFDFAFQNQDGRVISLQDKAYEGKVKIVQILGTWCPNCRDETEYLVSYLKEKQPADLAIIGLSFERHRDRKKALAAIQRFKSQMEVPYEVLYAGPSNKDEASKVLPMLNKIISYPTMIFLDRENQVRKIHTGFSGPATSAYASFVEEFETFMEELLNPKEL